MPRDIGVIRLRPDVFDIDADVGGSGDGDEGETGRVREIEFESVAEFRAQVRLAECVVHKAYVAGLGLEIAPYEVTQHSARDNETLLIALEGLPAVRGADVVHKHQVPSLPSLACGVCLVDLVDHLHDVGADRVAVAEASSERQPVLAVDVHEVLAYLRVHRPLVEECDLVEPAPLAGARVMYDG